MESFFALAKIMIVLFIALIISSYIEDYNARRKIRRLEIERERALHELEMKRRDEALQRNSK